MAREPWRNPRTGRPISGDYEKRLRRAGIRRGEYEAGRVSSRRLGAARGHAETPERPGQAARRPERFARYRRREIPIRVMTDQGPFLIRGLKQQDRSKVGRHWNAVSDSLSQGSDRPLRRYRRSYVGGYDDVEISPIEGPEDFRPIGRVKLAASLSDILGAVERDVPLSFEFIYEEQ